MQGSANQFQRFNRALWRRIITAGVRPSLSGDVVFRNQSKTPADKPNVVYVQPSQSLADALIVEKTVAGICHEEGAQWPNSPFDQIRVKDWQSPQSLVALAKGIAGRVTMLRTPELLNQLITAPEAAKQNITLVPVCVYWNRSVVHKNSFLRAVTSEQRTATAGLKRLMSLILNRGDVHVCFGKPIPLCELADHEQGTEFAFRRAARLLRLRFKAMQFVTLGPDHSHRRTLLSQVANAPRVRKAIESLMATSDQEQDSRRIKLKHKASKIAKTVASDLTYSTIRLFLFFLTWFWKRIYDGINVRGLDALRAVNDSHTLIYVPSHRSHIDYLVLSYWLHTKGIMLPHIAAGDNLNLPVLGRLLRQAGAFFMRRSFRDDPIYSAVFEEYLFRVLAAGHSVEFFPEGGRSRSGRLLAPKYGLLKLCLENQQRGLDKPLAFVPIYFGYEKVIEASSYLSELRGGSKQKEKLMDLVNNANVIRQRFGMLQVNVAPVIKLDEWLCHSDNENLNAEQQLSCLGRDIMRNINVQATVNPVNLVALAITQRTQLTLQEPGLLGLIYCYQNLATAIHGADVLTVNVTEPCDVITRVVELGYLERLPNESLITCSSLSATQLTWYRNNILHLFAAPSLIALLISRSGQGLAEQQLTEQATLIYPFIAQELTVDETIAVPQLLNALEGQQLIVRDGEKILPPAKITEAYEQLAQLSSLVLEQLQRMYVVIGIADQRTLSRDALKRESQLAARKLSRLFGLTGTEFSENKLFDAFVDRLLAEKLMVLDDNRELTPSPVLQRVTEQAAEQIIEPAVRLALQRVIAGKG